MSISSTVIFRTLHVFVALIAVIACVFLAFAKGHPPGLVFVPFVLVFWLIAHLILFGLKRFLAYMANPKERTMAQGWPPLVTLMAIGSGLVLLQLIYGLLHDFVMRSKWTELNNWMWAIMIFTPPTCVFGGIIYGAITGSKFARWIAAAGPVSYIGYISVRLVREITTKGYTRESWLPVIFVVGFCIAMTSYLLASSSVREFFASRRKSPKMIDNI